MTRRPYHPIIRFLSLPLIMAATAVMIVVILAISGWSGLMVAGAIRALEKLYDNY